MPGQGRHRATQPLSHWRVHETVVLMDMLAEQIAAVPVLQLTQARQATKVALVCDSMSAYGGAERVIEQILQIYPAADVFTVVDVLPPDQRAFLGGRKVRTSFLQRLPRRERYYRSLLPLWPLAVEQFDLAGYDLVISSHHSVAYGVLTSPGQVHIAYVHSPMRYAWDLQHEYLRETRLATGPKSWLVRHMLHSVRIWDFCAAQRPDVIVTNSDFVAERMRRTHGRDSETVYPPIAVDGFAAPRGIGEREGYYLSVGRLVPYKRIDLLARAFAQMPERRLKIVGSGPEMAKLRNVTPNIEVLGNIPTSEVRNLMSGAEAYLFAGVEDFGITAVEVQAAGTPVIAYGRGGLLETVQGLDEQLPTGVFFYQQTEEAIVEAVMQFERPAVRQALRPENCVANAARFSEVRFRQEFTSLVSAALLHASKPQRPLPRRLGTTMRAPVQNETESR